MGRMRQRYNGWTYDDARQEMRTPSGIIITVPALAARMQSDLACNYDFAGPWSGWRMRGARLIPPHAGQRMALKPDTAPLFARWVTDGWDKPNHRHT